MRNVATVTFAAEGWSFALTLGEPTNSSSVANTTGVAKPAIHNLFFVIVLFPFYV
jgi:hypothetical protein